MTSAARGETVSELNPSPLKTVSAANTNNQKSLTTAEEIPLQSHLNSDEQCITFGNFSTHDYDSYFLRNGVRNAGVEFLCDTFNATKCWVEEGSKHTFSYLENIEPNLKNKFGDSDSTGCVIAPAVAKEDAAEDKQDCTPIAKQSTDKRNKADVPENGSTLETDKPSSWASLFKSANAPASNVGSNEDIVESPGLLSIQIEQEKETKQEKTTTQNSVKLISILTDPRALALAEHISQLTPNFNRHHLQLRGLINRSNWCYINTTLQALLGIPAITHFYKSLKGYAKFNQNTTSTPLTDCMILFFNQFETINAKLISKKQVDDLRTGSAFEPRWVYDVLAVMKTTLSEKGRQEDAEEFLSFLLNGIHDELVELQKLVKSKTLDNTTTLNGVDQRNPGHDAETKSNGSDEESWEHVGKKNKASILRKAVIEESLIKHMFGGVIRSSVHQTGKKVSTTLQPFFTLQLDLQSDTICTLNDALESYFMLEVLQGFNCTTTNTEVEASRRTSIEELPVVLIFHLKYFVFDRKGGCQKIHKAIDLPVNLEIPKDILSPSLKSQPCGNLRNYKLCAIVYHHGKNAAGGHYTAAVHHGNPFGWVQFDDNNLKPVNVSHVLKHQQGQVPYLLFYEQVQAR